MMMVVPGISGWQLKKTDAILAVIDQVGFQLSGLAMGVKQGDLALAMVPGMVPFFLQLRHFCLPLRPILRNLPE